MLAQLAAFLGVSIIVIATPGQDTALTGASEPAFLALRLAGAAYLVFLGLQALGGALRRREVRVPGSVAAPPQFVDSFLALVALGLVFCTLTLALLTAYAAVVARAGDCLRRPRLRRALEAATDAVLVALGLRLAAER